MQSALLPLAAVALLLCGCTANSAPQQSAPAADSIAVEQPAATDTAIDTAAVKAAIERQVLRPYQPGTYKENPSEIPSFEHELCSRDYLAVFDHVDDAVPDGELGYFDFDHWIMAQDYDKPTARVVSITIESATRARADIEVTDFGKSQPLTFPMVLEDGAWKIDDFISLDADGKPISEKADMRQFMEDSKK